MEQRGLSDGLSSFVQSSGHLGILLWGWTLNSITKTLERLDADVRALPTKYVNRDDFHRDIDELKNICGKIFDRLEAKADK